MSNRIDTITRHLRGNASTSSPPPADRTGHTLVGRTALVTGSTSGIGLAIAEELARVGCNVVINGFGDADQIASITRGLTERFGVRAEFIAADATRPKELVAMVEQVDTRYGGVDVLVNNAGIQHVGPLATFPDEKWEQVIAINLSAAFYTTKAVVAGMVARGYGRIINVASAHGKVGSANKSAYCASKFGVVGLTKVTALETAGTGVTANTICPGWVLTPLVEAQAALLSLPCFVCHSIEPRRCPCQIEKRAAASGRSVDEERAALVGEKHPSKQPVMPGHVGGLAVFLCSDAASQMTGTDLSIDGGWTAI